MRIVVTGACGFIGSHLCDALIARGHEVRGYDLYNSQQNRGHLAPGIDLVFGDVRDGANVCEAIRGYDVVFHLAALIDVPYSYEAPESYVQTNVIGTLNILQASSDIGKIICMSSSEVYGTAQYTPMDELHPLNAQSPYAASKIAADQLALSFYKTYNLPIVTARAFNTYGPRQSSRAVIASIISQMPKKVKVGNLDAVRDFMHVSDTVAGLIACMENGRFGEVYNLGTGVMTSIEELLKMLGAEYEIDPERFRPDNSEVDRLCCDWSKAKKELGWEPKMQLVDGLCSLKK